MPSTQVNAAGFVTRKRGAPTSDGLPDGVPFRSGRYREEYNLSLVPKNHLLADEGSYFVGSNPTPGTAIAAAANLTGVPTLGANADTAPYIVVFNSDLPQNSGGNGLRIYLDSLQFLVANAGAAGTRLDFAVQIDQAGPRLKAGAAVGGTLINPVNPNMDDGAQSVAKIWVGANAVNASGGAAGAGTTGRLLPHRALRPVIPVVGDVYAVTFGGSEQFVGSLAPAGTAIAQQSFNYPPVVIGPQQVALIFLWSASNTTAYQFEHDLDWWER